MDCVAAGVTQAECDEYVSIRDEIGKYEQIIHTFVCKPDVCIPFLTTGRVVRVREGSTDWGWGVVLQTMFRPPDSTVRLSHPYHATISLEQFILRRTSSVVVLLVLQMAAHVLQHKFQVP